VICPFKLNVFDPQVCNVDVDTDELQNVDQFRSGPFGIPDGPTFPSQTQNRF
jgi:hypothetical protein